MECTDCQQFIDCVCCNWLLHCRLGLIHVIVLKMLLLNYIEPITVRSAKWCYWWICDMYRKSSTSDRFIFFSSTTVMRRYCWHGVTIGGTKLWNEIHQENYFYMTGLGCGETTTQVGCTVIKWCKMFLCFVVHPNVAKSWWAQWYKMCCHTYVIMMDACLCVPTGVPHYHGLHHMVEKLQS